jgi:hypothetical protein
MFAFAAAAFAALAVATGARAGALTISDAWFRALPAGRPAGGYFSLHNAGPAPVALVAARSSACGMLMLHQSTNEGGMSRMQEVKSVAVSAGGTVAFAPGGYHLMCVNPGTAMAPGGHVSVTLVFADKSQLQVDFAVKSAGGK